ncbi:GIY-YIG nuclease family protein [Psychroserpens luteus]|uniref:GIY-YIG nuclease family protein n=1 Tax=Psychroserpens luteus TaxID=1434066 RepID=A0ABW5ZYZ8_9FLAO|nr:GIY-YIG nuclease family protein [Psychroserpens luteus]
MKFYYVYMLKCSDDSIYTGMTNSIDRRLEEHKLGLNIDCYTYRKRPLRLIYHQEFMQFDQAQFYEKKIKKWSRSKKLALANEDFELLKDLSICKNETNYKNFEK